MHPIFTTGKNLAAAAGLWLLLSALVAIFLQSHLILEISKFEAITFYFPWFFILLFFCLSNYYICLRFPIGKTNFIHILIVQVSATASTVAFWFALGYLWAQVLNEDNKLDWSVLFYSQKIILCTIAAILYCFWVLAHYMYLMAVEQEALERDALEKKLFISQVELQTVRATTHPHFLYNALNTIANLSLTNPEKVHNLCLQISDFLRYSVNYSKNSMVTIHDELEHIQNYLGIERERFGLRLNTVFEIDEAVRTCPIIPLVLFPLLENAIKHGVSSLLEGGTITVQMKNENEGCLIRVRNPYDPLGVKASSTQLGLSALKKRLTAKYGKDPQMRIQRRESVFEISVFIPR